MGDILKTLFDKSVPFGRKFKFIFLSIALLLISDHFTSFPSLSFTKEKYETIHLMQTMLDDTSINPEIKKQLRVDMDRLSHRSSLNDYWYNIPFDGSYFKNLSTILSNISQIVTIAIKNKIVSIITSIISYLIFIFMSGFIFLLPVLGGIYKNESKGILILTAICVFILFSLINISLISIFNIQHHLAAWAFMLQTFMIAFFDIFIRLVRIFYPSFLLSKTSM